MGNPRKSLIHSNIGHLIADSEALPLLDSLVGELSEILHSIWFQPVTPNSLVHGQYLLLTTMISRSAKPIWLIGVCFGVQV